MLRRFLACLLAFVAVSFAAVPVASAQIVVPPPPIAPPGPVVTPVPGPDLGPGGTMVESICAGGGAGGWFADSFGYCTEGSPGGEAPSSGVPGGTVTQIPAPFSGDSAVEHVFSNLESWLSNLDSWELAVPGFISTGSPGPLGITLSADLDVTEHQVAMVTEVPASGGDNALVLWVQSSESDVTNGRNYWYINETHVAQCEAHNCSSFAHNAEPGETIGLVVTFTSRRNSSTRWNSAGQLHQRTGWSSYTHNNRPLYIGSGAGDGFASRTNAETMVGWVHHRPVPDGGLTPFEALMLAAQGTLVTTFVPGDGWEDPWEGFDQELQDQLDQIEQDRPQVAPEAPTWSYEDDMVGGPIDLSPEEAADTDTGLARRLLHGLGNLGDALLGGLGALGDLIWSGFEWLVGDLWSIAQWFWDLLRPALHWIGAKIDSVRDAIINFSRSVWGGLTALISWAAQTFALLGSLYTAVVGGFGAMISALSVLGNLPSVLSSIWASVQQIPQLIADLPAFMLDVFVTVVVWIFVPEDSPIPDLDDEHPWADPIDEIGDTFDELGPVMSLTPSCGPALSAPLPGGESIGWNPPNPPGSGCPGNGPGGAYTAEDAAAGDMFGYRVAVRSLAGIAAIVAFAFSTVGKIQDVLTARRTEHYEQLELNLG